MEIGLGASNVFIERLEGHNKHLFETPKSSGPWQQLIVYNLDIIVNRGATHVSPSCSHSDVNVSISFSVSIKFPPE